MKQRVARLASLLRDLAIFYVFVTLASPLLFAAWDKTKPATNSALVSADIRANWDALETALGVPTSPLALPAAPTYKAGGSATATAIVSGRVFSDYTDRTNSGTTETDAGSHSLLANTLNADGKALRITVWGVTAANANNKSIRVYFGATVVASVVTQPLNNQDWHVSVTLIRSGAATQRAVGSALFDNSAVAFQPTAPGETLSGAVTIKTTLQSATAGGDVTQRGMMIEVVG